jgi:multidrug transporter EmrE-like cation transporter
MRETDIIYIIIATFSAIISAIFIKKYVLTEDKKYIIIAVLFYVVLIITYIKMFKDMDVSTAFPFINILQIIIIVIGGMVLFNEKVNNKKIIGLALGTTSCYLLCT